MADKYLEKKKKEMFHSFIYQGNLNLICVKIPSYPRQNGCHQDNSKVYGHTCNCSPEMAVSLRPAW